jgi:hypothetical protein
MACIEPLKANSAIVGPSGDSTYLVETPSMKTVLACSARLPRQSAVHDADDPLYLRMSCDYTRQAEDSYE